MADGVKFPDIVRHENSAEYPVVSVNDVAGLYITSLQFSDFRLLDISGHRRMKNFVLSCANSLYQYISDDVSDAVWSNINNWRSVQNSFNDGGQYIRIVTSVAEIVSTYGSEEPFISCKDTNVIYKYLPDGTPYDGSEGRCINTKEGGTTRFVDITLLGSVSSIYLVRNRNLADVDDVQTALNNITNLNSRDTGLYLYFDGENMSFKEVPNIMNIKGRVDTVADLDLIPIEELSVGDVYLVGLPGSDDFYEYVCLSVDGSDGATWECLGKRGGDHPWVFDELGDDSIKLYKHGLVSDIDTITLYGSKNTVFSSQNVTTTVYDSNSSIFSSNGISVGITSDTYDVSWGGNSNTVYSSEDITAINIYNSIIGSSKNLYVRNTCGETMGTSNQQRECYTIDHGFENISMFSNYGNASGGNVSFVGLHNMCSIYGANIFGDRFTFGYTREAMTSYSRKGTTSKNNVFLGNNISYIGRTHLCGESLSMISNYIKGAFSPNNESFDRNLFLSNSILSGAYFGELRNSSFIGSVVGNEKYDGNVYFSNNTIYVLGYYWSDDNFYSVRIHNGYYYNGEFYSDAEHTELMNKTSAEIYIDLVSGNEYEYNLPTDSFFISDKSNYIITPESGFIYIDQSDGNNTGHYPEYKYDTDFNSFVLTSSKLIDTENSSISMYNSRISGGSVIGDYLSFINSKMSYCGISGENNMIINSSTKSFSFCGEYNSIDSCIVYGGIIENYESNEKYKNYCSNNKFVASEIHNCVEFSKSIVGSSYINANIGKLSEAEYITILSTNVPNSGTWYGRSVSDMIDPSKGTKNVLIGATDFNGSYTIGSSSDLYFLRLYFDVNTQTGDIDIVRGYKYNNTFYEDNTHTTPISKEENKLYIDLHDETSYYYYYVKISSNPDIFDLESVYQPYSIDELRYSKNICYYIDESSSEREIRYYVWNSLTGSYDEIDCYAGYPHFGDSCVKYFYANEGSYTHLQDIPGVSYLDLTDDGYRNYQWQFNGYSYFKGTENKYVKYLTILNSRTSGLNIKYGEYNTVIGDSGNGESIAGDHNIMVGCSNGAFLEGDYNAAFMLQNVRIYGNYNTCASSGDSITVHGSRNAVISSGGSSIISGDFSNENAIISSYNVGIHGSFNCSAIIACNGASLYNGGSYAVLIAADNSISSLVDHGYYNSYTLYTKNLRAKSIYTESYIGAMSFRGIVDSYAQLPLHPVDGNVYKVDQMTEVYSDGSGFSIDPDGSGSDTPIGYYPAGTCFAYNESSDEWMSLGGVIYYASRSEINEICS